MFLKRYLNYFLINLPIICFHSEITLGNVFNWGTYVIIIFYKVACLAGSCKSFDLSSELSDGSFFKDALYNFT